MVNRQEILNYYKELCDLHGKKLLRTEYRDLNPMYSSSLIENVWGNWTNFIDEVDDLNILTRHNITKVFSEDVDKIVITYVNDGCTINSEFYDTLLTYCSENDAELGILWGKGTKKNKTFSRDVFNLLSPYVATRFEFEKDKTCVAQDFLIPHTQKNPLLNLDKLSTNLKTIIVGSNKQYLQILPYKQYTTYRVACSTGTLSDIDYKETVANQIDAKHHTYGAILLEWNSAEDRYVIRNLIFKNGSICDLDKVYTKEDVKTVKNLPAIVLGDVHFPDEEKVVLNKTIDFINTYKPEYAMLHDIASWNSICHHNFGKCLFNAQNINKENVCIGNELHVVVDKITDLSKKCPNTQFRIVHSNHDAFVEKWLDTGEFVKDKVNARLGAQLFMEYCDGKGILDPHLPKNFAYLPKNESFNIKGFELAEHGDCGISGASGSPNAFTKTFENCICGHTHSPRIFESTVYVGTLSQLVVNYNQKGMTNWVNCNAVVYENGTAQLIFV